MKRLCGLVLFSVGIGMTVILIFPKNFFWVCITITLLVIGYHLFCN